MFLSADVISLVLYCAQQLGVTLGVGAQSIMLVAYLQAMRDGVVDSKEAQFVRAVRYVLNTGLALIILSGLGITALHLVASQAATIFSEAYLFKWALVLGVLTFTLLKNFPQKIMQGLAGGSWFALFIVHILAPVASWVNLLTLYIVWMVGFALCWVILVIATKDRSGEQKEKLYSAPVQKSMPPPAPKVSPVPAPAVVSKPLPQTPKPVPPPPPPPQPKPVPSAPPIQQKPPAPANLPVLEQKHIVQTLPQPEFKKEQPAVKKEENPWLPSIQIMPKTQDDASKHPVNTAQHPTQH